MKLSKRCLDSLIIWLYKKGYLSNGKSSIRKATPKPRMQTIDYTRVFNLAQFFRKIKNSGIEPMATKSRKKRQPTKGISIDQLQEKEQPPFLLSKKQDPFDMQFFVQKGSYLLESLSL